MSLKHRPVMLMPCLEGLNINPDGIYVDGTFGRGGHSQAILDKLSDKGRLIALDKDLEAINHANNSITDTRFAIYHQSFAHLKNLLLELDLVGKVNGILLDLGVSSPQLDDAKRGFSFMQSGPLDMRMNQASGESAESFIASVDERTLADIIFQYGEERYSRRIAKAICNARIKSPIDTTEKLAEIVKAAHPKWEKHKHPATRVFQAIRIYINRELDDLALFLDEMMACLAPAGRMVFLSFHSLEDRMVKKTFKKLAHGDSALAKLPIPESERDNRFKLVGKAIKADKEELEINIRARSAVLRIGEKIA